MDNIISFTPKEKDKHEKLTELLGTDNFLVFSFDDSGTLSYRFGNGMTDEQLCYLSKILNIIVDDTLKSNSFIEKT